MKWLTKFPFAAVVCGLIAAFDLTTGVMRSDWGLLGAGAFCVAMCVLNLYFYRSTRKAKKTVPSSSPYSRGGYISASDLTQAMLMSAARVNVAAKEAAATPAKKQPEPFHGLPFEFAVGEVYGLRMWHMDKYGRLRARNWDGAPPWRPGINVAKCVKRSLPDSYGVFSAKSYDYTWTVRDNPGHDVPSEGCSCGFYAYTDNLHAEVKTHARNGEEPVLGIIKGTGRTLIGTQGFRCEKAEIVAFRDPTRGGAKTDVWRTRQLAYLRRVYPDVPVLDNRATLLEFAPLTETMPAPTTDEFWHLP